MGTKSGTGEGGGYTLVIVVLVVPDVDPDDGGGADGGVPDAASGAELIFRGEVRGGGRPTG
jgi:hypothetical protein